MSSVQDKKIQNRKVNVPFVDGDLYSVVIDCGPISSEKAFELQSESYREKGFQVMLNHYGKNIPTTDYKDSISLSPPTRPIRPNENMKVLVSYPRNSMDTLQDKTFDEFAADNIYNNFIAISFRGGSIEDSMNQLAIVFRGYQQKVDNFSGTLKNFNFNKLANKVINFFSEFKNFINENGYSIDNTADNQFEFGFDKETFRLRYILYYDPYGKFLRIGIDTLADNFDSKTGKAIAFSVDILEESFIGTGWQELLEKYFPGEYEISFSKQSTTMASSRQSLKVLEDELDKEKSQFENKSFLTSNESVNQSRLISDPDFRKNSSDLLLRARDTIGDNFLIELPETLSNVNDLESLYSFVFDKVSVKDLSDIITKAFSKDMNFSDFNEAKIRGIIKALPADEKVDLVSSVLGIDLDSEGLTKKEITDLVDETLKEEYKNQNPQVLNDNFSSIPVIKTKLDKLAISKEKLLNKIPGLDIEQESKKTESENSFPSIDETNPSFCFEEFQFDKLDDISKEIIDSIESSIKQGIEEGLVQSFKTILENVVDTLNSSPQGIGNADFGGLNLNDLIAASDGLSLDSTLGMVKDIMNSAKEAYDDSFFNNSPLRDYEDFSSPDNSISNAEVERVFNQISNSLAPLETIRILKGQKNKSDLKIMRESIRDQRLKNILNEDTMSEIFDNLTDLIDLPMLDELENNYSDTSVFLKVCNDRGIDYRKSSPADLLRGKYSDLDDPDKLAEEVERLVDNVKDSIVDTIGSIKDSYEDDLPFSEDPCTFMPDISNSEELSFINDLAFKSIFDPIEIEYKSEVQTFPDLLLVPSQSKEYIKLYYDKFDNILDPKNPYTVDNITGEYVLNFIPVGEKKRYNPEFANHYFGIQTDLFVKKGKKFSKPDKPDDFEIIENQDNPGELEEKNKKQVYVRNTEEKLFPIPGLVRYYENPNAVLSYDGEEYRINFKLSKESSIISPATSFLIREAGSQLLYTTYDGSNVECSDTGSLPSTSGLTGSDYFTRFERSIKNSSALPLEDFQISNLIDINKTEDYDVAKQDLSSLPSAVNVITSDLIKKVFNKIGTSELLGDPTEIQTFILDTDTVNLLKTQELKNEAKDLYSTECPFSDDQESLLESSSISKLIMLTLRIYIIEAVARACFVYDTFALKEMNLLFCNLIYDAMESEMSKYPAGYYGNFKSLYEQHYGSPFPESSNDITLDNKFYELCSDIYKDISTNFDELFPKSLDSGNVIETIIQEIPKFDKQINGLPIYCTNADQNEERFVFLDVQREASTSKEELYSDRLKSGYERYAKLCYILPLKEYVKGEISEIDDIDSYSKNEVKITIPFGDFKAKTGYSLAEIGKIALNESVDFTDVLGIPDPRLTLVTLEDTPTLRCKAKYLSVEREYAIIPLAEQKIEVGDDVYEVSKKKDSFVYSFFRDVAEVESYYTAILAANNSKLLFEKPDVALAFTNTKMAIKKAIDSLSQESDNYSYSDKESNDILFKQSQGASTNPDFSDKAKKFALMTIPMIIKGAAEKFDPNIKVASKIRKGAESAGFDISPPVASLMALPLNVIPFAPGPPIGPLGITYLATSFLEPKERKKLADIRRGKNVNTGASSDGEFAAGSLEEQLQEQSAIREKAIQKIVTDYDTLRESFKGLIGAVDTRLSFLNGKYNDDERDYWFSNLLRNNPKDLPGFYPVPTAFGDLLNTTRSEEGIPEFEGVKLEKLYKNYIDISFDDYDERSVSSMRTKIGDILNQFFPNNGVLTEDKENHGEYYSGRKEDAVPRNNFYEAHSKLLSAFKLLDDTDETINPENYFTKDQSDKDISTTELLMDMGDLEFVLIEILAILAIKIIEIQYQDPSSSPFSAQYKELTKFTTRKGYDSEVSLSTEEESAFIEEIAYPNFEKAKTTRSATFRTVYGTQNLAQFKANYASGDPDKYAKAWELRNARTNTIRSIREVIRWPGQVQYFEDLERDYQNIKGESYGEVDVDE
jgi:hypothetical protein